MKNHQNKCADALANMPPAIAAMFTAGETKEQSNHRVKIVTRSQKFCDFTYAYRATKGKEPTEKLCNWYYARLTKQIFA